MPRRGSSSTSSIALWCSRSVKRSIAARSTEIIRTSPRLPFLGSRPSAPSWTVETSSSRRRRASSSRPGAWCVDLEKPPQVRARVLRDVSRPDNVRDDHFALSHVSHGRETLKPPQVRARVAVGTMPVGELECGRRAGALGGRARVGLDSERGPRVLGLGSARGAGR